MVDDVRYWPSTITVTTGNWFPALGSTTLETTNGSAIQCNTEPGDASFAFDQDDGSPPISDATAIIEFELEVTCREFFGTNTDIALWIEISGAQVGATFTIDPAPTSYTDFLFTDAAFTKDWTKAELDSAEIFIECRQGGMSDTVSFNFDRINLVVKLDPNEVIGFNSTALTLTTDTFVSFNAATNFAGAIFNFGAKWHYPLDETTGTVATDIISGDNLVYGVDASTAGYDGGQTGIGQGGFKNIDGIGSRAITEATGGPAGVLTGRKFSLLCVASFNVLADTGYLIDKQSSSPNERISLLWENGNRLGSDVQIDGDFASYAIIKDVIPDFMEIDEQVLILYTFNADGNVNLYIDNVLYSTFVADNNGTFQFNTPAVLRLGSTTLSGGIGDVAIFDLIELDTAQRTELYAWWKFGQEEKPFEGPNLGLSTNNFLGYNPASDFEGYTEQRNPLLWYKFNELSGEVLIDYGSKWYDIDYILPVEDNAAPVAEMESLLSNKSGFHKTLHMRAHDVPFASTSPIFDLRDSSFTIAFLLHTETGSGSQRDIFSKSNHIKASVSFGGNVTFQVGNGQFATLMTLAADETHLVVYTFEKNTDIFNSYANGIIDAADFGSGEKPDFDLAPNSHWRMGEFNGNEVRYDQFVLFPYSMDAGQVAELEAARLFDADAFHTAQLQLLTSKFTPVFAEGSMGAELIAVGAINYWGLDETSGTFAAEVISGVNLTYDQDASTTNYSVAGLDSPSLNGQAKVSINATSKIEGTGTDIGYFGTDRPNFGGHAMVFAIRTPASSTTAIKFVEATGEFDITYNSGGTAELLVLTHNAGEYGFSTTLSPNTTYFIMYQFYPNGGEQDFLTLDDGSRVNQNNFPFDDNFGSGPGSNTFTLLSNDNTEEITLDFFSLIIDSTDVDTQFGNDDLQQRLYAKWKDGSNEFGLFPVAADIGLVSKKFREGNLAEAASWYDAVEHLMPTWFWKLDETTGTVAVNSMPGGGDLTYATDASTAGFSVATLANDAIGQAKVSYLDNDCEISDTGTVGQLQEEFTILLPFKTPPAIDTSNVRFFYLQAGSTSLISIDWNAGTSDINVNTTFQGSIDTPVLSAETNYMLALNYNSANFSLDVYIDGLFVDSINNITAEWYLQVAQQITFLNLFGAAATDFRLDSVVIINQFVSNTDLVILYDWWKSGSAQAADLFNSTALPFFVYRHGEVAGSTLFGFQAFDLETETFADLEGVAFLTAEVNFIFDEVFFLGEEFSELFGFADIGITTRQFNGNIESQPFPTVQLNLTGGTVSDLTNSHFNHNFKDYRRCTNTFVRDSVWEAGIVDHRVHLEDGAFWEKDLKMWLKLDEVCWLQVYPPGCRMCRIAIEGEPNAVFGSHMAQSRNDQYLVVGAPGNGLDTLGRCFVYISVGDGWALQQELIPGIAPVPGNGDLFGYLPQISADGTLIIVAAINNGSIQGSIHSFTRSGTTWTEQDVQLSEDNGNHEQFGRNMHMNHVPRASDGNYVWGSSYQSKKGIFGNSFVNYRTLRVAIYTVSPSGIFSGPEFSRLQQDIGYGEQVGANIGGPASQPMERFGVGMRIQDDGLGFEANLNSDLPENEEGSDIKTAKILRFRKVLGVWDTTGTQVITQNQVQGRSVFTWGAPLVTSHDEETLLIGDIFGLRGNVLLNTGVGREFTNNAGVWTEEETFNNPLQMRLLAICEGISESNAYCSPTAAAFTSSIDVSADGTRIVIGERQTRFLVQDQFLGHGRVFVFDKIDGVWGFHTELHSPDSHQIDHFGTKVLISADGTKITASAPSTTDLGKKGIIYTFILDAVVQPPP